MISKYHTRPISWIVKPESEPIFSEMAIRVSIVDEAGGEFLEITDGRQQTIRVDPIEWPELKQTIEAAIKACEQQSAE